MAAVGRIVLVTAIVAVVAAALVRAPARADRAATAREAIVAQTERVLRDVLANLAARTGPQDPEYFAGGVWQADDNGYWYCNVGPGTAAAVLWRAGGGRDGALRGIAVRTFDQAISAHRNADGSFGDIHDSPDIATMSFGVQLGTAYLQLAASLDKAQRSRWQAALAGAADYLVHNGNLSWYTNGNINLGNVELFYLAWRATGEARFKQDYEQAWQFALNPPQSRWPGFGLHIRGASFPTKLAPGPGLAGYLSESGGARPGFDADYTVLQLDAASALYLLSGDPRAKRLSDLLANMLLPRVDRRSLLDTSGGTRHPEQGRHVPLLTSGLAILGWHGGRSDLGARIRDQSQTLVSTYEGALGGYSPYLYRGLGTQLSMVLLAGFSTPGPVAPL